MKSRQFIIYHGSTSIVKEPKYGLGKPYNDYGLGFYCAQSKELAKEWAVTDSQNGYANQYSLDMSDLKMLDLSKTGNVLHWITLLLKNRVFTLKSAIARRGKEYLISNFSLPIEQYDVIKGYRADDSYFSYANGFLNNTISIRQLKEALRLGKLGEQIVLISPKAFTKISFLGYEEAEAKIYYPLRKTRNNQARNEYAKSIFDIRDDDIFLNDVIKGVKSNDPRL